MSDEQIPLGEEDEEKEPEAEPHIQALGRILERPKPRKEEEEASQEGK